MNRPRLRGNSDLMQVLVIALLVALITSFLLEHLRTRRELYAVARARSYAAFQSRELEEQARHLRLEERIREAGVRREEAPEGYIPAPAERTVRGVLADPTLTPWEEAP